MIELGIEVGSGIEDTGREIEIVTLTQEAAELKNLLI